MKQIKFTSRDFVPEGEQGEADAVLDNNDPIHELKALAGVNNSQQPNWKQYDGINVSRTGMEKRALEKKHNIKPGTPEWFQLWFSLPYLTGESPVKQ